MYNTNESKEDKKKMDPTEENYRPIKENHQTSENYGAENFKTPYDDEEKLIGLVEPNSELAPPAYIDGPEAPPDYGKKSEPHPPSWKRKIAFLVFIFACAFISAFGSHCGIELAVKYFDDDKAVPDKLPCHKMSPKVEGVALGGESMGHHEI